MLWPQRNVSPDSVDPVSANALHTEKEKRFWYYVNTPSHLQVRALYGLSTIEHPYSREVVPSRAEASQSHYSNQPLSSHDDRISQTLVRPLHNTRARPSSRSPSCPFYQRTTIPNSSSAAQLHPSSQSAYICHHRDENT